MALSAILLLSLAQEPQELGNVTKQVVTDLQAPIQVVSPLRLALTPMLDGKIEEEEWDPFAGVGDHRAFVQWEPGELHVAGVVPRGHDLVVSVDMNNDGWLRGKDNIEVRASFVEGKVVMTSRALDNTGRNGPMWVPQPSVVLGSMGAAASGAAETTYELTISDTANGNFGFENNRKFGLRYDVSPTGSVEPAAFLPRSMSEVTLGTQRNAGMPEGLRTAIQDGFQTVVPGENTRMRVTFGGSNTLQLQRFELRSEGFARAFTATSSEPFPSFDKKGRTFVDYATKVAVGAPLGYRIFRGTVTAADGVPGIVQGSFRVAPLVDFMLKTKTLPKSDLTRTVRIPYGIRSNTTGRVLGGVTVELPAGWRDMSPPDRGYIINRKGFVADRWIEVEIPGGTVGTFPLKFRSTLGATNVEQPLWLTIG